MTSITKEQVIAILKTVIEKERGKSIIQMGLVTELTVDDDLISITVTPSDPACPIGLKMAYDAKVLLVHMPGVQKVKLTVKGHKHADEMNKMLDEL